MESIHSILQNPLMLLPNITKNSAIAKFSVHLGAFRVALFFSNRLIVKTQTPTT